MFVVVCRLGGKLAPDPRLGYTISQDGDWKVAANGIEFEAGILKYSCLYVMAFL